MAATVSETIDERDRPWGGMGDSAMRPAAGAKVYVLTSKRGEGIGENSTLGTGTCSDRIRRNCGCSGLVYRFLKTGRLLR